MSNEKHISLGPTVAQQNAAHERLMTRELKDELRLVQDSHTWLMNEKRRLESALRAIVAHWDEFGPEHGFDEVMDRARGAVARPVDQSETF